MENEKISENIRTFVRLRPNLPEDSNSEEFYLTSSTEISSSISDYSKDGSLTYFSSILKKEQKFKVDGFFDNEITQEEVNFFLFD